MESVVERRRERMASLKSGSSGAEKTPHQHYSMIHADEDSSDSSDDSDGEKIHDPDDAGGAENKGGKNDDGYH